MARNKSPEVTAEKILEVSKRLFLEQGYDNTTIQDIVNNLGGLTKGAVYHHFKSKEEIVQVLSNQMFFEDNSFDDVKACNDLNGLQKIQKILVIIQANTERAYPSAQSIPLLKNPRILASMLEANQQVLTPLWFELIEEGRLDGSIQTDYVKELSQLLPILIYWISPSIYPDTAEELRYKFYFIMEMLTKMGLPLLNKDIKLLVEEYLTDISNNSEVKSHYI